MLHITAFINFFLSDSCNFPSSSVCLWLNAALDIAMLVLISYAHRPSSALTFARY